MSRNTDSSNPRLPEFTERKQLVKKSCRTIQNLCKPEILDHHDSRSTVDYSSNPLRSSTILHRLKSLHGKSARKQHSSTRKQKNSLRKRPVVSGMCLPLQNTDLQNRRKARSLQKMIRVALKELHKRRVYISSALIANHLRRCYPIENDPDALKEELNEKLECAVSVGLIVKCGIDKYCIPTLRQEASSDKTAFTAFWNKYHGNGTSSTMEELFTFGLPRMRRGKMGTILAPKRSDD